MKKVHDIGCQPGAIWSCMVEGAIVTDTSDQRRVASGDLQDVQLVDTLRDLWRDCIERVRRRAAPEEWEPVRTRLADLERQLVG